MTPKNERPERFFGHLYPQIIPEPDDIEPGAPAPWSTLALSSRSGFTMESVTSQLRRAQRILDTNPLPDQPAELSFVADGDLTPITLRSAVLVALFEEDDEAHVILTRRSLSLRHHSGEIALPGGRCDEGETPIATALREAHEEVGLDPSLVTPVGWLSPIVSFVSSSSIWPIVGFLSARPTLTIDPKEVDRAFTVALKDLVEDGAFIEERWRRQLPRPGADADGFYPISFFRVPGDVIWGATARVLTELLCVVTGVPWPGDVGRRGQVS